METETRVILDEFGRIKKHSKLEAYFMVFWLLGPLFFLVERSPADLWIIIIDLAFLVRCFVNGDWKWTAQWWPKSVFCFWLAMFASVLFSPTPAEAAKEAFIWIRFPLLAFASAFWLAHYPALVRLLLKMTGVGLGLMMAF